MSKQELGKYRVQKGFDSQLNKVLKLKIMRNKHRTDIYDTGKI